MTVLKHTPAKHRHKPVRSHRAPYMGPVSHRATPEAQGGYTRVETCLCQARRSTNVNGIHVEQGAWQISEFVQAMLGPKCRGE